MTRIGKIPRCKDYERVLGDAILDGMGLFGGRLAGQGRLTMSF